MFRVIAQPEPSKFDELVRKPGLRFLADCPQPTQKQWNSRSYWRRILSVLHDTYSGICGYSCHWIPFDTGADTVEHFKPKTQFPNDAYEWSNYRLVCQLLNSRKGSKQILDPFKIKDGWFIIEFPSLLVKPAPNLKKAKFEKVKNTRDVLGLNDEATCMRQRHKYVLDYCNGEINFAHLVRNAPFLAKQMQGKGYDSLEAIRKIMNVTNPNL